MLLELGTGAMQITAPTCLRVFTWVHGKGKVGFPEYSRHGTKNESRFEASAARLRHTYVMLYALLCSVGRDSASPAVKSTGKPQVKHELPERGAASEDTSHVDVCICVQEVKDFQLAAVKSSNSEAQL